MKRNSIEIAFYAAGKTKQTVRSVSGSIHTEKKEEYEVTKT